MADNIIDGLSFNEFNFDNFISLEIIDRKKLSENVIQDYISFESVDYNINKISKVSNMLEINVSEMQTNKIVKPVNMNKFTFNVYDCSEDIETPLPTPISPIPSLPPIIIPPKTYLFSGINPINNQIEIWYDTTINSKGPNGKVYIQVGIVELDSTTL